MDGDNIRIVDREDITERSLQVGESTEDGCPFCEGTGRGDDGLLMVTCQVTAVISAAPL